VKSEAADLAAGGGLVVLAHHAVHVLGQQLVQMAAHQRIHVVAALLPAGAGGVADDLLVVGEQQDAERQVLRERARERLHGAQGRKDGRAGPRGRRGHMPGIGLHCAFLKPPRD
jgi:hypothetical protein